MPVLAHQLLCKFPFSWLTAVFSFFKLTADAKRTETCITVWKKGAGLTSRQRSWAPSWAAPEAAAVAAAAALHLMALLVPRGFPGAAARPAPKLPAEP